MKVLRIFNWYPLIRRECSVELACERCGIPKIIISAWDDRNYWDNVIPNLKCEKCQKSTNDLGLEIRQYIKTRYAEHEIDCIDMKCALCDNVIRNAWLLYMNGWTLTSAGAICDECTAQITPPIWWLVGK